MVVANVGSTLQSAHVRELVEVDELVGSTGEAVLDVQSSQLLCVELDEAEPDLLLVEVLVV